MTGNTPVTYRTCEHLFQCLRFSPEDPIRAAICAEKSPMSAKMVAKQAADRMTVSPRSEQDILNMRFVLLCKLQEHPNFVTELLATGDAKIIEDVTARPNESGLFWGMVRTSDGTWQGQNILGNLWMERRTQLCGK